MCARVKRECDSYARVCVCVCKNFSSGALYSCGDPSKPSRAANVLRTRSNFSDPFVWARRVENVLRQQRRSLLVCAVGLRSRSFVFRTQNFSLRLKNWVIASVVRIVVVVFVAASGLAPFAANKFCKNFAVLCWCYVLVRLSNNSQVGSIMKRKFSIVSPRSRWRAAK